MADYQRLPARFIFTEEIKGCTIAYKDGEDQFAAMHTVSPCGQDIGRVFLVGTLVEVDDIGSDASYMKGRIVDNTGSILAYAGQYQPEAAIALEEMEVPAYVAVTGKVALFTTEDGTIISSLRIEEIHKVDEQTKQIWTFLAARNLIEFLEDDTKTRAKQLAEEHYSEMPDYKEMAQDALEALIKK